MASITLGDMAQSFALRRQDAALQADVRRLSTEIVTGRTADAGRAVGGDFSALSSLNQSLSRLEAYGTAGAMAATRATGTRNALDMVDKSTQGLGARLVDPNQAGNASTLDILAENADQSFRTVVATLNTRAAGQSLFAGNAVDGPAMADAGTILSALEAATAGQTSAAGMSAAIDGWFTTQFDSVAYRGGADRAPVAVGEGEHVNVALTAREPALVDTLKGLAMAALLGRGALDGRPAERQAMADRAGDTLLQADAARVTLQSRFGVGEERLADIRTRNTAQGAALELARADMLKVDPYETAVRLEAARTQIETLYAVTARLSRMSMADKL